MIEFDGLQVPLLVAHHAAQLFAAEVMRLEPDRILLITDQNVMRLHGSGLPRRLNEVAPVETVTLIPGEGAKTLPVLGATLDRAVAGGISRRSVVVAFGGGVVGNVAGTVAGMLYRGIRLVHCPTTLLAMHDSVISLKQAINSPRGKNLFGCFLAPSLILIDPALLETLPGREWRSGLCEAIKNALAARPAMIARLERELRPELGLDGQTAEWIIRESIAAKVELMREDRHEKAAALRFEYGHTVGHAIEFADGRRRGGAGISHGEAVGLGMLAAAAVASRLGYLSQDHVDLHRMLLERAGAPLVWPEGLDSAAVAGLIARDNKRGYLACGADEAPMILLRRPGEPVGDPAFPLTAVPLRTIDDVLSSTSPRVANRWTAHTLPEVTVIMLTDGVRPFRDEAAQSVFQQDYRGRVRLLLMGDNDSGLETWRQGLAPPPNMAVQSCTLTAADDVLGSAPVERVARIRSLAVALAESPFIAFVDDDNHWDPNHLSSLVDTALRTGVQAVHSWRRFCGPDGAEQAPESFPWLPADHDGAPRLFELYRDAGVFRAGDPVVRDAVTLPSEDGDLGMVDMGEWLFRREVLAEIRFSTDYDEDERALMVGEDDKLLCAMRERAITTACTQLPTLRYRLGGFSNGPRRPS